MAARRLVDAVTPLGPDEWTVRSGDADYRVARDPDGQTRCACAWYLKHGSSRGPCKHALAVQLAEGAAASCESDLAGNDEWSEREL